MVARKPPGERHVPPACGVLSRSQAESILVGLYRSHYERQLTSKGTGTNSYWQTAFQIHQAFAQYQVQ
jgi:hypothetical protein